MKIFNTFLDLFILYLNYFSIERIKDLYLDNIFSDVISLKLKWYIEFLKEYFVILGYQYNIYKIFTNKSNF